MFNLRILLFTSVIFLVSSLFPNNIFASVRCETQYGGGEICTTTGEVQINKAVFDPANSKYVDNLFVESYRFSAGEEILFRLGVKNVGNNTLNTVHVWDNLPSHLEVASGSTDFYLYNLAPGENRDFFSKPGLEIILITIKLPVKTILLTPKPAISETMTRPRFAIGAKPLAFPFFPPPAQPAPPFY